MDTEQTRVIFRRFKAVGTCGPDFIAFFPDQHEHDGLIGSYMHVGQHGAASYPNELTVPAVPAEYEPLRVELESIGYNLKIIKRYTRPRSRQ